MSYKTGICIFIEKIPQVLSEISHYHTKFLFLKFQMKYLVHIDPLKKEFKIHILQRSSP